MEPVPRDGETIGEVMMRGNVVMNGYLKNRKSTDAAFAGGWFHTGDLGVMHPDGYIQLKDRSKDIIISGGENISSIEVEDALYKHPAVQAAAVVAKPDDKWGETPCAFVELKPGAKATADELIAQCRANLAGYKVPRHVVFTEVPKTSTGKIQKFRLREMAKGGREAHRHLPEILRHLPTGLAYPEKCVAFWKRSCSAKDRGTEPACPPSSSANSPLASPRNRTVCPRRDRPRHRGPDACRT